MNESPYKSVKDIVAAAQAAPGKLSYASGGVGGTHHLSGALFEHAAEVLNWQGLVGPKGLSPDIVKLLNATEAPRWGKVVRDAKVEPE